MSHALFLGARSRRAAAPALAVLGAWAVLVSMPARGEIVLNEVLYDPIGDDAGAEFVEIWNPGDDAAALVGVAIESGDGAHPGIWIPIFAGAPGDSIPPHGAFLVGADRLTGPIQNGPDAIRLTRNGVVLDVLGWGALTDGAMFEGAPALDVASGATLARTGDGVDTDRNDIDWAAAETPTPGRANHPARAVALARPLVVWPEVVWPGQEVAVRVTARNVGVEPLPAGAWGVRLRLHAAGAGGSDGAVDSLPWLDAGSFAGGAVEPGAETRIEHPAPALLVGAAASPSADETAGLFVVRAVAWVEAAGAVVAWDSTDVAGRVGTGPLVVQEIAFRDDGVGEWVEALVTREIASWAGFTIGDASGAPRPLRALAGSPGARAGSLRVIAADPARLVGRFAIPESLIVVADGGWPSLNDTAPTAESAALPAPWADVVRLATAGGAPSDAVPYAAAWSARGASVERLSPLLPSAASTTWSESIAPLGGTPGAPNSIAATGITRGEGAPLLAAPRRVLDRGGADGAGALVLEIGERVIGRTVRLAILDLRGRTRRVLADGARFGGAGAVVWDGRDDAGRSVVPGIYVAVMEASASGAAPLRASISVAVAPVGRPR